MGIKPEAAGLQAQTNPLSFGGTPSISFLLSLCLSTSHPEPIRYLCHIIIIHIFCFCILTFKKMFFFKFHNFISTTSGIEATYLLKIFVWWCGGEKAVSVFPSRYSKTQFRFSIFRFSLSQLFLACRKLDTKVGGGRREPRSNSYGRRLMFPRLWVQIPAPYTGWTFFTFICYKNCDVCLKKTKINEKYSGVGPYFLKSCCWWWRITWIFSVSG